MVQVSRIDEDGVRGQLHRPDTPCGQALALTHGAGSDADAPLLVAVAAACAAVGVTVLRFDLAFRQRRPRGPPSPARAAEDRASIRTAVAWLRARTGERLTLGGHSYGGRQATLLAADDPGVADGLLLLSYPLHPPKRPDRPRTEHFPRLRLPALFVHGDRDGFGTPDALAAALAAVPGPARLLVVPGAGHDLRGGRLDWAAAVAAVRGDPQGGNLDGRHS